MFEFDRSAARGEMNVRGLWVFTHDNEKGNAPAHKLFELISVLPLGHNASGFQDYTVRINAPPDGKVTKYPEVTIKRLV